MNDDFIVPPGEVMKRGRGRLPLPDAVRKKREESIIRLRGEGLSNEAIAEALDLSYSIVTKTASELIQTGRLNPQHRGISFSDALRRQREESIIRLRGEGLANKAIAEALELSLGVVTVTASKLIKAGRLDAKKRGPQPHSDEVNQKREEDIIRLKKQRATLEKIGNTLGVTKQRAEQLIKKVVAKYGEDVFSPDESLWTVSEAAKELSVERVVVFSLCQQEEIPCQRRGLSDRCGYMLSQEGMDALKRHLRVTGKRVCVACKKIFIRVPGKFGGRVVCSDKCLPERYRVRRKEYLAREPTLDSLNGWHRELWQLLQSRQPQEEEQWLTLSEAKELTGLTKMQVIWLGLRRIVTIHRDPSRIATRTGKSQALYATSEMEIARQAYVAANNGQ